MFRKIKFTDVFIVNKVGIALFALQSEKSNDPDLISGTFTAIQMIIEQSTQINDTFKMGFAQTSLYVINCNNYYLLGRTLTEVNELEVFKLLHKIKKIFDTNYGNLITKWNGNMETFASFKNVIQPYFEDYATLSKPAGIYNELRKKFIR